ncbi:MAG: hypothetical protein E7436_00100 [Ruminococcaceae bacterium]|nr:hypothetical protein [Oscillospiraceae bacterium]
MDGKKKFLILVIIALLVFLGWGFDTVRAREFTIEVVSVSPEVGIADGQTQVTVELLVTRNGVPCEDHIIYGISLNGGNFRAKRVKTDENGIATFIYFPYFKSELNDLVDVNLHFEDESNSLFIAVSAKMDMVLPMEAPEEDDTQQGTNEGMFG